MPDQDLPQTPDAGNGNPPPKKPPVQNPERAPIAPVKGSHK